MVSFLYIFAQYSNFKLWLVFWIIHKRTKFWNETFVSSFKYQVCAQVHLHLRLVVSLGMHNKARSLSNVPNKTGGWRHLGDTPVFFDWRSGDGDLLRAERSVRGGRALMRRLKCAYVCVCWCSVKIILWTFYGAWRHGLKKTSLSKVIRINIRESKTFEL